MTVIERIYQLIDKMDLNVSEFSDSVEVSNGYFAKQKTGKGNVGSQIIEKIVSIYPQVNADWLISGRGKMFHNDSPNNIIDDTGQTKQSSSILKETRDPYNKSVNKDTKDFFFELLERKEKQIKELNREIGELQYKYKKLLENLEK
nr:hypothetical protein [uncultured Bacteroides sp.]